MKDLFLTSNVRHVPTADQLARAQANMGSVFPPSYKAFCLRYGYGLIGKFFEIYVPRENTEDEKSITYRSRMLRERLAESRAQWREDDMKIGVDVWEGVDDPGLVERAVFFGQSYDGHDLFWDVKGQGEYRIYVGARDFEIRFGGNTLDEFIQRCQSDAIKSIFGPGYEPLPSLFEGRD